MMEGYSYRSPDRLTEAPLVLALDPVDVDNFELSQRDLFNDLWKKIDLKDIVDKLATASARTFFISKIGELQEDGERELERSRRFTEYFKEGRSIIIEQHDKITVDDSDQAEREFVVSMGGADAVKLSRVDVAHMLEGLFPHRGENAAKPRAQLNERRFEQSVSALTHLRQVVLVPPALH